MASSSAEQRALAAGLALMAAWGVNFAITKAVLAELGVWPFLFIRFLAMPIAGFALLLAITRRHFLRTWPQRADLPRFVAAGLVGHTAHVSLVMWGIDLSTAFSSSLVLTSSPLWTLLILSLLGAEKLHGRQLAGTLVAFAGIVVFLSDKFVRGVALAGAGDLVLLLAAADSNAMPAARSASPPAFDLGLGSRIAATTRTTPDSMSPPAHGGVRPWWLQGSRLT